LLTNKHSPIHLLIASMNHTPCHCRAYIIQQDRTAPRHFRQSDFYECAAHTENARAITFVRCIRDNAQSSTCSSCSCFTYKPLRIWHSSRIPCPTPRMPNGRDKVANKADNGASVPGYLAATWSILPNPRRACNFTA